MPEAPEPTAQVIDLMEALRASLDKKQKAEPQRKPAEAKKPAEARKPPRRAQHAEPTARKAARK